MNRRPRKPYTKLPASVKQELGAVLMRLTERIYWPFVARDLQIRDYEACIVKKGKLAIFSAERLLVFLTRLGCDIEICILPPRYDVVPGPNRQTAVRRASGAISVHDLTGDPFAGHSFAPPARPRAVDARRPGPQFQGIRPP